MEKNNRVYYAFTTFTATDGVAAMCSYAGNTIREAEKYAMGWGCPKGGRIVIIAKSINGSETVKQILLPS